MTNEEQLAIYLKMDLENESDKIVLRIIQDIIEGKPIDHDGKQALLKYIRRLNHWPCSRERTAASGKE